MKKDKTAQKKRANHEVDDWRPMSMKEVAEETRRNLEIIRKKLKTPAVFRNRRSLQRLGADLKYLAHVLDWPGFNETSKSRGRWRCLA